MGTIVHLEPDDELTTAAARIRSAAGGALCLVVPAGSRLGASRINLLLIAREAEAAGVALELVLPDPAARTVAAAAGLAAWPTLAAREAGRPSPGPAPSAGSAGPHAVPRPRSGAPDAPVAGSPAGTPRPTAAASAGGEFVRRAEPTGRRSAPRGRLLLAGGLGVVALVGLAGVAALVVPALAPTATITITPAERTLAELELEVTADPAVAATDPATATVAATVIEVPVELEGSFAATGTRLEETTARGGVRWSNCDPTRAYTIPDGTRVRTASGVEYAIEEEVFLPVAVISGSPPNVRLTCSASEVAVTAVLAGPEGNVAAGAITVVPAGYNRNVISATNPLATAGGSRIEHPVVTAEDVAAATAALGDQLVDALLVAVAALESPSGREIVAATARLGEALPTADPAALVGIESASFELGLAATGTVLAADGEDAAALARGALAAAAGEGWRLDPASVAVTVGPARAADGAIRWTVRASGRAARVVDAGAVAAAAAGLAPGDARAALADLGEVAIALQPAWAATLPDDPGRIVVVVAPAGGSPEPPAVGEPLPSG